MLNRQDSLLSSSHRRTPPPENLHATPVGCMSGFFKLFSKYQNRNKLLTFGRKHVKSAGSTSTKSSKALVEVEQQEPASSSVLKENTNINNSEKDVQNFETNRLSSCDITPRSPMLPPEIRRSDSLTTAHNSAATTPPTTPLVARLMGLEQDPQLSKKTPWIINRNVRILEEEKGLTSTAEEKRRKLLQALHKCNEDLESLKKIIMTLQSADDKKPPQRVLKEDSLSKRCMMKKNVEQVMIRPVSALEHLSHYLNDTKSNSTGIMPQQIKRMLVKKPGGDETISICRLNKVDKASLEEKNKTKTPISWSSKAVIQSVDEVCNDIVLGEKRELGNIGLGLQNHICRELIEEAVFDLGFCKMQQLPFDACKKRLSF